MELKQFGQLRTKTIGDSVHEIRKLISELDHDTKIVVEDYRVYGWESDKHKWAALHTPQLIGSIKTICDYEDFSTPTMRMAVDAKKFVTDEKLQAWGMYKKGMRHARDAIRHAVYSQIFDK